MFGEVIWATGTTQIPDYVAKLSLQAISNTFQVEVHLCLMKKAKDSLCKFCKQAQETLFHWQQECPQFREAQTAVHNDIWGATTSKIQEALTLQWRLLHETTIAATELGYHDEDSGKRRPDGILRNSTTDTWICLDFQWGG